ncbi:uncharacterized protein LOC122355940 isoform X3 [Puntigrus tetrazona]|uniref:uncharacterized protein LOC122355940 isoform X3 n=1 Tax=Puntigrus tetrazona TaxID=1606681 RepID=UPI001C8946AF|nr:uncharacterized protein LOC122355940 isoform X3 [Puntigrus tetrazona]
MASKRQMEESDTCPVIPKKREPGRDIQMKQFNDPIHGHMELHPLLVKIIDTPQFQRLRHIKQLGTKYLVYPGATHTRFEHSLGVAYLAGCLLKSLRDKQPELMKQLNITDRDVLCVQIAALCHDMGHGPLSHLFDGMFIPQVLPDKNWEHENASVDMFKHMVEKNGLKKVMEQYGLDPDEDIVFIGQLIKKEREVSQRSAEKAFLYEIVANKVNGIDVDKWDYLARDCHYLGIPNGFDCERLLKSARVCVVDGTKQICFRDKVADNVYNMFYTRYTLHRQALQHNTGYIIDIKMTEALIKANEMLKISDAIFDMEKFTNLTDHICDQISQSTVPELKDARDILDDITQRRLPKFVGEARLSEENFKTELKKKWTFSNVDPQIYVASYKPNIHHEWLVRVYHEQPNVNIQRPTQEELKKYFAKWCEESHLIPSEPDINSNRRFDHVPHKVKFIGEARMEIAALKTRLQEEIVEMYNQKKNTSPELEANHFETYVLDMGFGEVGKEPIDNVHFYSKENPDIAFKMKKEKVSTLKPKKFHEWLIRLYYNNTEDKEHQAEVQQIAEKCFHDWCRKSDLIDSRDESADVSVHVFQTSSGKIFNDPIHGQIELPHLLVKIIDTPQFQRLRHIKQLGGTYLVYPGATHTRFEHSLGSAYLAGQLAKVLQEKQKDLKITKEDILCVQIAALCYNLGHGPFSYVFKDMVFPKLCANQWKPEVASAWIFLDIVESNEAVKKAFKDEKILDSLDFIKDLICSPKDERENHDKSFLFEIVANKQNYIDVRKWDYLARDCHYLGIPNSFDHQRLLKSALVCKVPSLERNRICFRDKVADDIYVMFNTQYSLYRQAYMHKTVKIIEEEISGALVDMVKRDISEITELISRKDSMKTETSAVTKEKMEKFLKLTDHIFEDILYSTDDELKNAQMTLKKVVKRCVPKCIEETRITNTENKDLKELKAMQEKRWKEPVGTWNTDPFNVNLREDIFKFRVNRLNYNQKDTDPEKDPIKVVYFYRKRNPTEVFKIKKYEVSSLLPEEFTEYICRVYYEKKSDKEEEEVKKFMNWRRRDMVGVYGTQQKAQS